MKLKARCPQDRGNAIYQFRFDTATGRLTPNSPAFLEGPPISAEDQERFNTPTRTLTLCQCCASVLLVRLWQQAKKGFCRQVCKARGA